MTTPDTLRAIIARVEAAEGADREVDAAIPAILGVGMTVGEYLSAGLSIRDPKPYTASLDAAVSLVPSGWRAELRICSEGSIASVSKPGTWCGHSPCATSALALTAAALRARLAMQEDGA